MNRPLSSKIIIYCFAGIICDNRVMGGTKKRKKRASLDVLDSDGLSERQRRFIACYLNSAKLSSIEAARMAGYSAKSRKSLRCQGLRLLANAAIQKIIRSRLDGAGMDRVAVVALIQSLARASLADMLEPDAQGRLRLSLERAAETGTLGWIADYHEDVRGTGPKAKISRRIRLHDPARFIEILARHHGIIGDDLPPDVPSDDDPAKWPVERVREFYAANGWELPDAIAPRDIAPGSGRVDASGAPIIREGLADG